MGLQGRAAILVKFLPKCVSISFDCVGSLILIDWYNGGWFTEHGGNQIETSRCMSELGKR